MTQISSAVPISVDERLKFEQSHRRPNGVFSYPVMGFGPRGDFTFWVVNPGLNVKTVFEGGRATQKTIPCQILNEPEILELRDKVLRTFAADEVRSKVIVDLCFLDYAAAVLLRSYTFTDDELTMLLEGSHWQEGMVKHCLLGEDLLSRLSTMGSVLPAEAYVPLGGDDQPFQEPTPEHAVAVANPARPGIWRKLMNPFRSRNG